MLMLTGPCLWLVSQLLLLLYFWLDNGANTCGIDFHFEKKKKTKQTMKKNIKKKTEDDSKSFISYNEPREDLKEKGNENEERIPLNSRSSSTIACCIICCGCITCCIPCCIACCINFLFRNNQNEGGDKSEGDLEEVEGNENEESIPLNSQSNSTSRVEAEGTSEEGLSSSNDETEDDSKSIINDDELRDDTFFEFKVLEKLFIRKFKVVSEEGR